MFKLSGGLTRRQLLAGGTKLLGAAAMAQVSPSLARAMSTPAGADEPLAPTRLSEGWEFFKGPLGGPWEVWHSQELAVFEKVSMPHCFNATDGCDPEVAYYRGPGGTARGFSQRIRMRTGARYCTSGAPDK